MTHFEQGIKDHAADLGFDLVGIAAAGNADTFPHFQDWLDADLAGAMNYMHQHAEARRHPSSILPNVRSVIMVAMNYRRKTQTPENSGALLQGRVASYAQGRDYHDVLREKLKQLLAWIGEQVPNCRGRAVVDTAPLLERDFARRAGLGWFGKNTMLLNKQLGSFFFLGALLLDIELQADAVHETSHCGTCTACLDACPTDAFTRAGELDARKCISYLTIELRGTIPADLRSPMGDWIFGCDVCQDVCPWNRKAPLSLEPALKSRADLERINLIELLSLSEEEFRTRFHGTALTRAKRSGLLRNAAIALGNSGDAKALPALRRAAQDADALISEAAQWAVAKLETAVQ